MNTSVKRKRLSGWVKKKSSHVVATCLSSDSERLPAARGPAHGARPEETAETVPPRHREPGAHGRTHSWTRSRLREARASSSAQRVSCSWVPSSQVRGEVRKPPRLVRGAGESLAEEQFRHLVRVIM